MVDSDVVGFVCIIFWVHLGWSSQRETLFWVDQAKKTWCISRIDKGFSFTCVCSYMVNVRMHACLRVKEKQKAKGHHDRPGYYKKSNISH